MEPITAEIRIHGGRPSLFLDGLLIFPMIYSLTDCPGGRLSYEEIPAHSLRKFVDIGFSLFQLDVWLEDMWTEDGSLDISIVIRQIQGIARICPRGGVFLRFHVTPPRWWNLRYPDECVEYADVAATFEDPPHDLQRYLEKDNSPVKRHSYASDIWIRDVSDIFREFLLRLSETPEGNHLIGIHPATGVYGEHHNWSFVHNEPDVSGVMKKLYAAHRMDNAGKAVACLPGMEERTRTSDGIFRDPLDEENTIAYYDFVHSLIADRIIHFCKLAKETWPRSLVTGTFYGYYISLFGRAATGGHLAEEVILSSPYVDYLSAPQAYTRALRDVGGAGAPRGLLDSVRLHGKLWLDEMDQPTHVGTLLGGMPVYGLDQSVRILRRNMLTAFVKGMGLWFYDFGPTNHSGWWNHPSYMEEIRSTRDILAHYHSIPYKNQSDVLLVFDTKVFLHTAHSAKMDPITDQACVNAAYPAVFCSGAVFDAIYLSDISKVNLDPYRCVVFLNTFVMDDSVKFMVKERVMKENRHVFWFFAPGYCDGKNNSTRHVEELTGIRVEKERAENLTVETQGGSYSIVTHGKESRLDWVLVPRREEHILGTFTGTTLPAVAFRKFSDHTSWFFSLPVTSSGVFRHFFKLTGVHIFQEHGDALFEGGNILVFHTASGGDKTITLRNGRILRTETVPGETILLDSLTGEVLRSG